MTLVHFCVLLVAEFLALVVDYRNTSVIDICSPGSKKVLFFVCSVCYGFVGFVVVLTFALALDLV